MQTPRHRLLPSAFTLALALTGCGGAVHHRTSGPPVYLEQEPNGSADNPDYIGWVGPGSFLRIEGHVEAFGPDQLDGFRFRTTQPMTLHVVVYADAAAADIDLCVYDPDFDSYIACFDSPFSPEEGSFSVLEGDKAFDLVVETFVSATYYTIEVRGHPLELASVEGDAGPGASAIVGPAGGPAGATPVPGKESRREEYRDRPEADPEPDEVLRRGIAILVDGDGEVLAPVPWIARVER